MNIRLPENLARPASTLLCRALEGAVRIACPPASERALAMVADAMSRLDPESVSIYERNAAALGLPEDPARAPRMQRSRARWLLEMLVERDPAWLASHVSLRGEASLTEALRAGRGATLLWAHLGVPDLGARALVARGHRLAAAMDRPLGPLLWRGVVERRSRRGVSYLPPAAALPGLTEVLGAGGLACFAWDGQSGPKGADPLRGIFAATLLASRARSPLLRAACLPVAPGRYELRISPPLPPPAGRTAARRLALAILRAERAALAESCAHWSLRMQISWPAEATEKARECA